MGVLLVGQLSDAAALLLASAAGPKYFASATHDSVPDEIAREVEALVCYGDAICTQTLDNYPKLRWIQVLSSGVELLPFADLTSRSIVVTTVRGVNAQPIAEHVLALILGISRGVLQSVRQQRFAHWPAWIESTEARDKVVGILGTGSVGSAVASAASALGMRCVGWRRSGGSTPAGFADVVESLEEVLDQSDFVVVCLPQTVETLGLIASSELALMRRDAWLINVSRAALIDHDALFRELSTGTIAGAALDVFTEEPLDKFSWMWTHPQVIVTPHSSGRSVQAAHRGIELTIANIANWSAGRELFNVLDLARRY